MKKIITIVGARPQFVKAAIVSRAFLKHGINEVMIHTGQHYDPNMSEVFFEQLEMKKPDYNLEVGSLGAAEQLAKILEKLSPILDQEKPDAVHVYGDTNSTVAGCIAAAAKDIPVIHTEAGERIFRRYQVPEEVNRVITDCVASLNLTCTKRAKNFLLREGLSPDRVKFVGDPMYDLFHWGLCQVEMQADITPEKLGLEAGKYHLATVHRAQNTADKQTLLTILAALDKSELPVVLPIHPRVENLLKKWDWQPKNSLKIIESLGYFDFLNLLINCKRCFTDSGGVTREAFFAQKPCIVPMENSWWADIVESGWMTTCNIDELIILDKINSFTPSAKAPEGIFGDANSSEYIAKEIKLFLEKDERMVSWNRLGNYSELPSSEAVQCNETNYHKIVDGLLKADYEFIPFTKSSEYLKNGRKFVLLRHDIDFCLSDALNIAKLEAEKGIKSTYFFMVRTEHYNLFSKVGTSLVKQILSLGHHFGLHFDTASYPVNSSIQDIKKSVRNEIELLEKWFNKKVEIVSFHRPNELILTGAYELTEPIPHTYMSDFVGEIEYISDSRGKWRNGDPLETTAFKEGKPLHILIHPVWWKKEFVSPHEALQRFVDQRMEKLEKSVAENNTVYRVGHYSSIC